MQSASVFFFSVSLSLIVAIQRERRFSGVLHIQGCICFADARNEGEEKVYAGFLSRFAFLSSSFSLLPLSPLFVSYLIDGVGLLLRLLLHKR